jgi:hypothetical protein
MFFLERLDRALTKDPTCKSGTWGTCAENCFGETSGAKALFFAVHLRRG